MATSKATAYTRAVRASNIKGNFVITNHQISTWSEDSDGAIYYKTSSSTVTITKSGYYPMGVVGVYVSGTNADKLGFGRARLSARASGSATVQYCLERHGNGFAHSNSVWNVQILWVKE